MAQGAWVEVAQACSASGAYRFLNIASPRARSMSLRAWVGMLKLSATARLCCRTQCTLGARRRAYLASAWLDSLRVAQELCED